MRPVRKKRGFERDGTQHLLGHRTIRRRAHHLWLDISYSRLAPGRITVPPRSSKSSRSRLGDDPVNTNFLPRLRRKIAHNQFVVLTVLPEPPRFQATAPCSLSARWLAAEVARSRSLIV